MVQSELGGFAGQVVVVTGASRGLGAGMARAFAAEGMRLGLCARNRPELPTGAEAVSRSVDVADAGAVERFLTEVIEQFGRIDMWINNAGLLAPIGPLADAEPSAIRHQVDVNVMGVIHGTASFARHVRARTGQGVLVNISSGAASRPYEGWAAYCGSKAAVDMITEVVAREEYAHGLRAFALAPGVVDTDMQSLIRSTPVERFPDVDRFHRLYAEDGYNSSAWVARYILGLVGTESTGSGEADDGVRRSVPKET
jgi:benzil reductase ((S)-benzoin forming)